MKTGVPWGPGPRLPFTDAPRDLFTHLPEKNDPEFRRFFLLKNPAFPGPRAAGREKCGIPGGQNQMTIGKCE